MTAEDRPGMVDPGRLRLRLVPFLVAALALGVATKLYSGPGEMWVRGSSGGIFYVAFFTLLCVSIRPQVSSGLAVTAVLAVTTALEMLQLWHPPALARVRSSLIGQTLIGGHFSWFDLPFYVIGAIGAELILRRLKRRLDET